MKSALRDEILAVLSGANDMTIATIRGDGYPQATTVSYANDDLTLYFGCGSDSQPAVTGATPPGPASGTPPSNCAALSDGCPRCSGPNRAGAGRSCMFLATTLLPSASSPWHAAHHASKRPRPS